MPELLPAPSQSDIDALFAEARAARVIEGGAAGGKPLGSDVIATFSADELPELRDALRIAPVDRPFHCMCRGDLAIELRGRLFRVGVLSYHHGVSIRVDDGASDANLVDGPALLRLLAERGAPGPLERYEAEQRDGERRRTAHDRWLAATPEALRAPLESIESDSMGLPRPESDAIYDAAVSALRASGKDDGSIADDLFAWIGSSDSPWSGFPAYEGVPFAVLRRLPPEPVLAALIAASSEAALLGAARYAADHQIVSFRKKFVRSIPEATFSAFEARLARSTIAPSGLADAKARLAHARSIAASATSRAQQIAAQRGRDVACVAMSDDGPFDSLVTDGNTIVATDVFTVVRVDPERGSLEPLTTYEGSPFTELAFVGGALLSVRGNEERVDRISLDGGGRSELASSLARPLHPVDGGGALCFVSAPFEDRVVNGVRSSFQRTSLVRLGSDGAARVITPVPEGVAALAGSATHLYYTSTNLEREGSLSRVAHGGGGPSVLIKSASFGHAMARPCLVIDDPYVFFADGPALRRVRVEGGAAETLYRANNPIGSIAVLPDKVILIVGAMSADVWDVVRVPRGGGKAEKLAELPRRPFHRLRMVARRGDAYFTLDDRLYRAR